MTKKDIQKQIDDIFATRTLRSMKDGEASARVAQGLIDIAHKVIQDGARLGNGKTQQDAADICVHIRKCSDKVGVYEQRCTYNRYYPTKEAA